MPQKLKAYFKILAKGVLQTFLLYKDKLNICAKLPK